MRTTVDIDTPILEQLKALQRKSGESLGRLVSELLADALARRQRNPKPPTFHWTARPMRALVDLEDKDAVHAILDADRS